jgi:type II secretory pathway pseudopilin PulG
MSRVSVPAFSLVELLLVMVLSSIIVGIIYFSYSTISAYQIKLSSQKRIAEDAATLYFILKKDVQQSEVVLATSPETILCKQLLGNTSYSFYHRYVLRQQVERVDTFIMRFERPRFFQQGVLKEVYPFVVDEILLTPQGDNTTAVNTTVFKYYDAAMLIEINPNDTIQ